MPSTGSVVSELRTGRADNAFVKNAKADVGSRWWNSIGYRRRYASDRTWFGAAFGIAGLGGLIQLPGWWKAPGLVFVLLGVALVQSGVRRALRRRESDSHEPRPGAPW